MFNTDDFADDRVCIQCGHPISAGDSCAPSGECWMCYSEYDIYNEDNFENLHEDFEEDLDNFLSSFSHDDSE